MDKSVKDKIQKTCSVLKENSEKTVFEIDEMRYIEAGYKSAGFMPAVDESWKPFGRNDYVSGCDKHYWFYTWIKTPEKKADTEYFLELTTGKEGEWDATNPQVIAYINGNIVHGMDINHRHIILEADEEYNILLYFYVGMNDAEVKAKLDIKERNTLVRKLYYDMTVPLEAALCFEESDYNYIKIIKYLEHTCNLIDLRRIGSKEFYESIEAADDYLCREFYEKMCGESDAVVSYVGHTHIDVAWLWSLAQTREKVQRSFSNALDLMDRYPEFVFMSSQPQLYKYLKEEAPDIYERVKARIREGRWEAEGAMWLEADCNLSSGESLIRQIMYGKRFIKEEFGTDSHILWLPDVFGYSAALPQILKKTGVDKFVTSKISWNETNKLPYDSFMWEGIDGTEIFTYFITAQTHKQYKENANFTTYVGTVTPEMNLGTWERYQQKEYNNETLVTFGYGDGGGGPTEEMLEYQRRLQYGLPGMPKSQISRAGDFIDRIEKRFKENCNFIGRTPKWVGELYLEMHRGTYTSIAKNKKNNRECEFLCQTTETLSVTDKLLCGSEYPGTELSEAWMTILLNQFHDIIPGSSIKEVYDESDIQYGEVRNVIGGLEAAKLESLASNVSAEGLFVYNPNSFEVSGYVENDGNYIYAESVPPMGWKVIKPGEACGNVTVADKYIESAHYKITFDENMNIKSLFDKDNDRECAVTGKALNRLKVFEDYPYVYDNWEISNYYKQKMWEINDVQSVETISASGAGGYKIVRRYMDSTIEQTIIVYSDSRRIDVKNKIDWHEHHVLLKAAFPVNIHANNATYEIQFGNIERPTYSNTSWDWARFEVCAQKWADLSEEGYGVSILNDCKYGYSTDGNEMSITLLKCGTYPNDEADQGLHTFTYSIYPHKDSFRQGGTIEEAYLLNNPLKIVSTTGKGTLPPEFSLVSCDEKNIFIETVKQSESGNGIVIRLYEAWNKRTRATIKLGFNAKKIFMCDMLENSIKEVGKGNSFRVSVSNFEIVTIMAEM